MIESNLSALLSPFYKRLSESQLRQIHDATLEIMERTGVRFYNDKAVTLFKKGGADITDNNRVHIPSWRVEWALNIAPKQIILYDQEGKASIRLSGRKSYYGNGSDLPDIVDHRNDQRRKALLQDIHNYIKVLDALPNYDFVMSGFIPSDMPEKTAELQQMMSMLENTNKPILYVTTSLANTQHKVAMAEIVAGGENELRMRPFAANYINITAPLRHDPESIDKLLFLSEKRLPFVYRPAIVTRGLTTPITIPAFLAVNNAAALAGLVLSQLKREGAPFVRCSSAGGTFDMQTTVGLHSAPEVRGFNEDLAHFYDQPCFGIGGTSASKAVDEQAALEAALTLITSTLAGAQLIHDVGYMDSGTSTSLIHVVICHEIISWIKHYMKGLDINDETLALDLIEDVGTDGLFIDTAHTFEHFREDEYPELRDHQRYGDWLRQGGKTLKDRAKVKVDEILESHEPQGLKPAIRDKLQQIVESK